VATTKEEHLAKAREVFALHNALDLNLPGAIGWSITMLFYAALHYVEGYLVATKGFGCKHHFSRATEIRTDPGSSGQRSMAGGGQGTSLTSCETGQAVRA